MPSNTLNLHNDTIGNNNNKIESLEINELEEIKSELLKLERIFNEKDEIEKFKDKLSTEGSLILGFGLSASVTLMTIPGIIRYTDVLIFFETSMALLILSSICQIEIRQTINESNFIDIKECFKFGFKNIKTQIKIAKNNKYFLIHRLSLDVSCICMFYAILLAIVKH